LLISIVEKGEGRGIRKAGERGGKVERERGRWKNEDVQGPAFIYRSKPAARPRWLSMKFEKEPLGECAYAARDPLIVDDASRELAIVFPENGKAPQPTQEQECTLDLGDRTAAQRRFPRSIADR
jgi:hypothetical protein